LATESLLSDILCLFVDGTSSADSELPLETLEADTSVGPPPLVFTFSSLIDAIELGTLISLGSVHLLSPVLALNQ
jgi:hypothetical protein